MSTLEANQKRHKRRSRNRKNRHATLEKYRLAAEAAEAITAALLKLHSDHKKDMSEFEALNKQIAEATAMVIRKDAEINDAEINDAECICQDLQIILKARLDMVEKKENKQYEVPGICICPIHGKQKFIAFYVRNTRDVDLSGFMTGDDNRITGYCMH